MELVFLDRFTLKIKDFGYVDSNFEINLDLVLIQKSTFEVNKSNINASSGDVVTVKDNNYFYIGVIETLEHNDKYKTIVHTLDFKEILNIDIPVFSYSGDIGLFIENLIVDNFINSSDEKQNLSYISIEKETIITGDLIFEKDKIMKFSSILELINKSYGVNIKTEIEFLRGRINGIKIRIVEVNKSMKIKSNISAIRDLVINDSDSKEINKLIFYPKKDNVTFKNIITYYLLTNNEITTDSTSSLRFNTTSLKSLFYSDNEFETLLTKARNEMIISNLDHNISFNLKIDNMIFKPFDNINLGDFIEFITDSKHYNTVLTAIKFKNGLFEASITLGEYRIKLTDKLQLLNKSVQSSTSNISIINNQTNNIDGGEF